MVAETVLTSYDGSGWRYRNGRQPLPQRIRYKERRRDDLLARVRLWSLRRGRLSGESVSLSLSPWYVALNRHRLHIPCLPSGL